MTNLQDISDITQKVKESINSHVNYYSLIPKQMIVDFRRNSMTLYLNLRLKSKTKILEKTKKKIIDKTKYHLKISKRFLLSVWGVDPNTDFVEVYDILLDCDDNIEKIIDFFPLYESGQLSFTIELKQKNFVIDHKKYIEIDKDTNPTLIDGFHIFNIFVYYKKILIDFPDILLKDIPIDVIFPHELLLSSLFPQQIKSIWRKMQVIKRILDKEENASEMIRQAKLEREFEKRTGFSAKDINNTFFTLRTAIYKMLNSKSDELMDMKCKNDSVKSEIEYVKYDPLMNSLDIDEFSIAAKIFIRITFYVSKFDYLHLILSINWDLFNETATKLVSSLFTEQRKMIKDVSIKQKRKEEFRR